MSTRDQVKQANFVLRYSLQSFGVILLLAVFIRLFLISSYAMSGAAMLPTIWPGDFLIASKWRVQAQLQRGQVVALRCPFVSEGLCLKRVLGLPGDRIEFRGGQLLVNGEAARHRAQGQFETESVSGESWAIWPEPANAKAVLPVVVPPQTVFLLNDKRSDREDSRLWGPVAQDLIEARVRRVWMSLDWYDGERVRTWPRVRWARLMRAID